ncbi:predicted protein [Thalassiosira pseudonana CCMP1335]|uniref:Uncharacterized protein n=1 Tax=Thalassiosira pseudonana TaxID=35128 RepID=B8C8F7_THAPS|nr:predicted protein [Thalassiosira pseudonana CCMP1335]EED90281.1 predicted protein [Thalassiosira pseudonana CCMP1335]|eukprot:scaffold61_cov205-Alexandrium_tamarense.AAC.25
MDQAIANSNNSATDAPTDNLNMDNVEDLDVFVKELMDNMQTRFSRLSDTILGRIDDMGSKIDDLEKNISELMEQAGVESPPTTTLSAESGEGMKRSGGTASTGTDF